MRQGVPGGAGGGGLADIPVGRSFRGIPPPLLCIPPAMATSVSGPTDTVELSQAIHRVKAALVGTTASTAD
jgi:hypothetical protein